MAHLSRPFHAPVATAVVVAVVAVLVVLVASLLRPGRTTDPTGPSTVVDDRCTGFVRTVAAMLADPLAPVPVELPPAARQAVERWRASWSGFDDPHGPVEVPALPTETARLIDTEVAARCAAPP
jgi:hypothetical protein